MADNKDWDKELAKIDRLMAKQGINPAKEAPPEPGAKVVKQEAPDSTAPAAGKLPLKVWLMGLLGPVGAGALMVWPYTNGCGAGLTLYLVGVVAVLGAAIWTMRAAWRHRRGVLMVVGILTMLAGLAFFANELLPRLGYAAEVLTWTCST